LIIGGFLCCFFGSILIAWAVALLLAVAGSLGIFLIVYNLIPYDVPRAVLTLLLLVSLGAGVVVGRFGYKWSKSHSIYVPIIGGWGGLVLATLSFGTALSSGKSNCQPRCRGDRCPTRRTVGQPFQSQIEVDGNGRHWLLYPYQGPSACSLKRVNFWCCRIKS